MLRNYLIIAWRNLLRRKLISLINICGLAIGISTFMIIAIYVSYELSYDDFFKKKDQIYRYEEYRSWPGEDFKYLTTLSANHKHILAQFPEVKQVARLYHRSSGSANSTFVSVYDKNNVIRKTFEESASYGIEQEFLDMFDIRFLYGDRSSALKDIRFIVISKSMALKYFGKCSGDLLGETMFFGNGYERPGKLGKWTITGIYEDLPQNTHFCIDMMTSYITMINRFPERYENSVDEWKFHTYVLLHETSDKNIVEEKISSYYDTLIANGNNISIGEYIANQEEYFRIKPVLKPVSSMYFSAQGEGIREYWKQGNKTHVLFLSAIALITLFIAWINYVNLSLVQIMSRTKEAGLRKVIGANKRTIAAQFMMEALFANLIALYLSITIISLVLPSLPEFIGKPLAMRIWFQGAPNSGLFWLSLGTLFFISFLVTSLYPSLVFSKTNPVNILKNQSFELRNRISSGKNLRAAFVFTQFASVYVLLGVTLGIYLQLHFFQQKDLGFNKEQILVVRSPLKTDANIDRLDFLKEGIKAKNISKQVTLSSSIPANEITWGVRTYNVPHNQQSSRNYFICADDEFLPIFNLKLVAGRNFNLQYANDNNAIIINKKLLHNLGYDNPHDIIGHEIILSPYRNDPYGLRTVIGVIDDYHHFSPKEDYLPISIIREGGAVSRIKNGEREVFWRFKRIERSFISLRISAEDIQRTVAKTNELWKEVFPGFEFNYFFADQNYDHQYRAEMRFGTIFLALTLISISLACLGFLGMSLFLINQRTKEIGIRKIMGASLTRLFGLVVYRFIVLILFAGLVGIPFTYLILRNLLNEFAFRINLSWWLFAIPLSTIVIIAILTIAGNTFKKVNSNPINALRYE